MLAKIDTLGLAKPILFDVKYGWKLSTWLNLNTSKVTS